MYQVITLLYKPITAKKNGSINTGNQPTWGGKIGLMYPSDYGYATLSSYWENYTLESHELLSDNVGNYNWMRDEIKLNELTISHSYSIDVRDYAAGITSETGVVSPVLYLKSTVKITGGTGSYDNPYILN